MEENEPMGGAHDAGEPVVYGQLTMRTMRMRGYRGWPDTSVTLHPGVNILSAGSTAQASAVLHALACGLALMRDSVAMALKVDPREHTPTGEEARPTTECVIQWSADTGEKSETRWQVKIKPGTTRRRIERKALFNAVEERLGKPACAWPVIGYYGPGAPGCAGPHPRVQEMNWRLAGYCNALDANQDDRALMVWIEDEWVSDIMARDHGVPERGLASALCTLIGDAVPEIERVRPRVGRQETSLDVTLRGGEEMGWRDLRAGTHRRAALIGDIGRRAMTLNAGQWSNAPEHSTGTVLIDAIDDTREEQMQIIHSLERCFPKLQIVIALADAHDGGINAKWERAVQVRAVPEARHGVNTPSHRGRQSTAPYASIA